jgi:hypothetical protein
MQRMLLVTAASTLQTGAAGDKAVTKHRPVSPKEDSASFACGVPHDGTCVSGISIGDGRYRACAWGRVGDTWRGTALPQTSQLGSQVVVISGNGQYVASIDGEVPCLGPMHAGATSGRRCSVVIRTMLRAVIVIDARPSLRRLVQSPQWSVATRLDRRERIAAPVPAPKPFSERRLAFSHGSPWPAGPQPLKYSFGRTGKVRYGGPLASL